MMRLMTMLAILLILVACTASANSAQCAAAESKKQGHALLQAQSKANAMSAHGMEAYPTRAPKYNSKKPCSSSSEEYMSPPVGGLAPVGVEIIDVVDAANVWDCLETCMHSFHAEGGNGQCAGTMFNSSAQDLGFPSCTRYYKYYKAARQTGTDTVLLSVKGCVTAISSTTLWTQETGKKCGPCWEGNPESACFIVESPEGCQALAASYDHAFFQYRETADDPDHPGGKCATMNSCSEPKDNGNWSIYVSS